MVLCDIKTPDKLKEHFVDLPPIFKNTGVSREDIGDIMRTFAEAHKMMSKPRRMLLSSYEGTEILLATPLLQWYLANGLKVTNVYEAIEYTPLACFKAFGDAVSDARREGDKDKKKAVVAETIQLCGNSSYGKTITNKSKHCSVKYLTEKETQEAVNKWTFRCLNQLDDDLYEVTMNKKNVEWNLPSHIGFFVYQLAKLRMLQLSYDFMDVFVDRSDFEHCQTDTDSCYIALSGPNLESVIRPELKTRFYRELVSWQSMSTTQERV